MENWHFTERKAENLMLEKNKKHFPASSACALLIFFYLAIQLKFMECNSWILIEHLDINL